jgi:NAD(P)-dependent dehydrogenase (short-subunit alcohol dehydrogenase family)
MLGDLEGKKVIIIGGSTGIGYATAELALEHGADVVITSRDGSRADRAVAELRAVTGNSRLDGGVVEITKRPAVASFLESQAPFDHLVLPGSTVHRLKFDDLPETESRESFDGKFWGPFWAAYDGRHHIRRGGSIIFYSGAASRRPLEGYVIGAAIDGAIDAATRSLAWEMAKDGIRVNCISPGIILTDIIRRGRTQAEFDAIMKHHAERVPLKRVGDPEECARGALYLMTCGFVTGEVLGIDGGAESAP